MLYKKSKKYLSNPVKRICHVLNINQKSLSLKIGVSEGTVNRWASEPSQIPSYTLTFFTVLEENHIMKQKLLLVDTFFSSFKEILNTDFNFNVGA